jgi:hypothetical protein
MRGTLQPQSSSQESTSHTALRHTHPPHSNRRAPLVSHRPFFMINFELTCTPALFHTHGVFLEDDLGADLLPSPLQTHPIPIAIAAISLCGSSADAHPSDRSIYPEKTPK